MKSSKRIAKVANEIVKLEQKLYTMDDVDSIKAKIDKLMSNLTPEEMIEVDAYISENNLLP